MKMLFLIGSSSFAIKNKQVNIININDWIIINIVINSCPLFSMKS
jgi:hypothetical protein